MSKERIKQILEEIKSQLNDNNLEQIYDWFVKKSFSESTINKLKKRLIEEVFSKYFFTVSECKQLDSFFSQLSTSLTLKNRIRRKNNIYYVYPESPLIRRDSREHTMPKIEEYLNQLLDASFSINSLGFFDELAKKEKKLKQANDLEKDKILNNQLAPYYGDYPFMRNRLKYVIECVKEIINSELVPPNIRQIFIDNFGSLKRLFLKFKLISALRIDEYTKYDMLVNHYKGILEIERNLSKYMQPIWDKYLTNPSEFNIDGDFHFLTHTLSEAFDYRNMSKACCTLATNNCFPNLSSSGSAGYIMKFDISQISTMCTEDAGSWLITKKEFIDDDFRSYFQLSEEIAPGQYVFYEYPKLSLLILPWNMEKEMIKANGGYGAAASPKASYYSEVFMRPNGTNLEAIGKFARDEAGLAKLDKLPQLVIVDVSSLGKNIQLDKTR